MILITTKKGRKGEGIGISVSHTQQWEKIYATPDLQNEFGSGSSPVWALNDDGSENRYTSAGRSFGPRFDGKPFYVDGQEMIYSCLLYTSYNTYIGRILEKYFRDQLILSKEWSAIGSYWENGNKNEIDIVAVDEFNKRMVIGEVKHNPNEINLGTLEYKARNIAASHKKYTIESVSYTHL